MNGTHGRARRARAAYGQGSDVLSSGMSGRDAELPAARLPGREAECFWVGAAVVLGQGLAEGAGPVGDGAAADLAAREWQVGNGDWEAAGMCLAHFLLLCHPYPGVPVPAGRCGPAPEQGARRVRAAGLAAGTGPGPSAPSATAPFPGGATTWPDCCAAESSDGGPSHAGQTTAPPTGASTGMSPLACPRAWGQWHVQPEAGAI